MAIKKYNNREICQHSPLNSSRSRWNQLEFENKGTEACKVKSDW